MRTKVWVETEVEVEVSASEMIAALSDLPTPEKMGLALSGMSTCLTYIKKMPDAMLSELNDKQREIIVATLEEQAARYKTPNGRRVVRHSRVGEVGGMPPAEPQVSEAAKP